MKAESQSLNQIFQTTEVEPLLNLNLHTTTRAHLTSSSSNPPTEISLPTPLHLPPAPRNNTAKRGHCPSRWYQASTSDEGEAEKANPAKQFLEPTSKSEHRLDSKCQCCRCYNSTKSQKPCKKGGQAPAPKYHPSTRHHLKQPKHRV